MKVLVQSFTCIAIATVLAASHAALAQSYPVKPIKMLSSVPLAASGDIEIRLLAAKMTASMGQPIIVETNGAAGGTVAARLVARSAPDGYTLFHGSNGALASAPFLNKEPGYDPLKDFTPISLICNTPSFIVVNASVPVNSVKELVDYAKRNPGKLSYGSNGVGSFFYLTGETFKMAAGVDIQEVPYTGGNVSLAVNDLLTGRIQVFYPSLTLAGPHMSGGKIKLLAILNDTRLKGAPNVPSIAEAFPAYTPMPSWFGVVGPAALPRPIVSRVQSEIAKVLAEPEVSARLTELGMSLVGSTPEAFAAAMKSTMDFTGNAVRTLKIEPQ
jgi:tripartite-type tricarboxylate transporter receptor subunit TctC